MSQFGLCFIGDASGLGAIASCLGGIASQPGFGKYLFGVNALIIARVVALGFIASADDPPPARVPDSPQASTSACNPDD
jgi:hypothetical protein